MRRAIENGFNPSDELNTIVSNIQAVPHRLIEAVRGINNVGDLASRKVDVCVSDILADPRYEVTRDILTKALRELWWSK